MKAFSKEWRDIPGYEGLYQVSDQGEVKSLTREITHSDGNTRKIKGRILKPFNHSSGYLFVNLSFEGTYKPKSVHTLVAMTFLKHHPSGLKNVVDHIDHNKLNNSVSNLRVVTMRKNSQNKKGKSTGEYSSKHTGVGWHKSSQKWRAFIKINGKQKSIGGFETEEEAFKAYQEILKPMIK